MGKKQNLGDGHVKDWNLFLIVERLPLVGAEKYSGESLESEKH